MVIMNFMKKNKNAIWLAVCVLIHTLLLYMVCDFDKAIGSYDEIMYYNLARSMFNKQEYVIHGIPYQFQKLLYVYYLMPFFAISDSVLRIKVITFVNSLLMSMAIILVWLICKELNVNKKYSWLAVIVIMIWPEMLTAGMLMSENLYWILSILAMYLCIKSFKTEKMKYVIFSAIACYLVYFCKEVGICLALAYIAAELLFPMLEWIFEYKSMGQQFGKNGAKKWPYANFIKNRKWINIIIFILVYICCHILCKKLFFDNISNEYSKNVHFFFLEDLYSFIYFLYGVVYYIVAVTVGFCILPVLYPILQLKRMSDIEKKSYIYAVFLLLGTILVIVCTITVTAQADLGEVVPRVHMRYLSSLIAVFVPVFFAVLSNSVQKSEGVEKREKSVWLWLTFGVLGFCVFKGTGVAGCANEHLPLSFVRYLAEKYPQIDGITGEKIHFYPYALLINSILCIILIVWCLLSNSNRSKKYLTAFSFCIIAVVCLANNAAGYSKFHFMHKVTSQNVEEMRMINNYFHEEQLLEKNVILVTSAWPSKAAFLYDTYFDGFNNYEISYESLKKAAEESADSVIDIANTEWLDIMWNVPYSNIETIDYFIWNNSAEELTDMFEGLERIPEISGESFSVYKNVQTDCLLKR